MFVLVLIKPKRSRSETAPSTGPAAPFPEGNVFVRDRLVNNNALWDSLTLPMREKTEWRRRRRR